MISLILNKKIKIHPITIIFLNALIPAISSIFPSPKLTFFTLGFSLFIMFYIGLYKRLIKVVIYLSIFLAIYNLIIFLIRNETIAGLVRMTILFTPCFVFASILITEYSPSEILSALQSLKLPKFFIIGLVVTIRYIPTFKQEFKLIKQSMKIRGINFSIFHPLKSFEFLIVPQLFRCLILSSELTSAGFCKGITYPCKRTSYFKNKFSYNDLLILLIIFSAYFLIIGGFV